MTESNTLTIYTHPECDYSQAAKADMEREGIPFTEIDVTVSPGAIAELERLTGGESGVPRQHRQAV